MYWKQESSKFFLFLIVYGSIPHEPKICMSLKNWIPLAGTFIFNDRLFKQDPAECHLRPAEVSYLATSSTADWHKPLLYPSVVNSGFISLTAALVARRFVTTYKAITEHSVCLTWESKLCFNLDSKYLFPVQAVEVDKSLEEGYYVLTIST